MKTEKKNFSTYQEIFLKSRIRREIYHLNTLIECYFSDVSDSTFIRDKIIELKTLYRQLFGKPFRF